MTDREPDGAEVEAVTAVIMRHYSERHRGLDCTEDALAEYIIAALDAHRAQAGAAPRGAR